MDEFEIVDLIDREYAANEEVIPSNEVNNLVTNLNLFSDNITLLTNQYTDILEDENVVYIMTKISQNPIFMRHFPEFYEKNENGESVINCQQNSPYHRFGVFKHILYTVEYIGKDNLKYSSHDMRILKWTMLLHDIGKPRAKTVNAEGYDSFYGHDDISVEMAKVILDRFDFEEQDKNIILNLIKYHDKFLNEGEITYDNLSFLAKELGDKQDLFKMLIEVKIADNKAKSIDVYNKFMTVVGKYYEFANEYFVNQDMNNLYDNEVEIKNKSDIKNENKNLDDDVIINKDDTFDESKKRGVYSEGGSNDDITEKLILDLIKDITVGRNLRCYYQPIIDAKNQNVNGYEVFYKIVTDSDFSYKQILKKAREFGKYDKLQQMLFVNALERFNELKGKREITEYINIDAKSYENYVNKARIFDMLDKNKVVMELNNFEALINSRIKELSKDIIASKGSVAIDNFESTNKVEKDIEQIEPKYIKYRITNDEENTREYLQKLITFCELNSINLIAFGIDTKELFEFALGLGIRYLEGNYISPPIDGLDISDDLVKELLNSSSEELIV